MLNPSTADHKIDDATIRRCIFFAKREECRNLTVVNLFAYRSRNPKDLEEAYDPCGTENFNYLQDEIKTHSIGDLIICAWGANKFAKKKAQFPNMGMARMYCLKMNADGSPGHPLYIPNDAPLIEYRHWWTK
jgi:hypothetical protein